MHDLLLSLFLTPFIASALILCLGSLPASRLKPLAFLLSLAPLAILLWNHSLWLGGNLNYEWLPTLGIHFHMTIDSLSLVFLYLTALIVPISIYGTKSSDTTYPNIFYGLVLILEGLLIGFFTAGDLVMFTIFWEAMLLPLYFMISIWGGERRESAALQFLVYMVAGSALLVAAVLGLYLAAGTFSIAELPGVAASVPYAGAIFAVFLLAFAVKTPLFPFHAWLPDTYYEAPTTGTILLSGILSKAGIYGIIRIGIELFPKLMQAWSPWLLGLAIVGVFYGAFAAWRQHDYKRLIAYSSLSHVNFVLVGIFLLNKMGLTGGILQAVNHGVTIAALFLVAGWLEHRVRTTSLVTLGGLAKHMPKLCWLTLFFVLASVALPGTNNFVGELLIFFGLFQQNPYLTPVLGLSIIFSVVYMLRLMQKIYFGPESSAKFTSHDIRNVNFLIATPLIILVLWIGIYPERVLKLIKPAVETAILELRS